MDIVKCSNEDIKELAILNKQLIEDEKSDNPMSVGELGERMTGFINGDYDAFFFKEDGVTVGYALVRRACVPPYLRQFFIAREYRRRHFGKQAFEKLMKCLSMDSVTIDVLPWNERGLRFWKSLGFNETCVSMKYEA